MMTDGMQTELRVPLSAAFAQQTSDFLDSCLEQAAADISPKQAKRLHIAVDEISSNLLFYSDATEVTCRFSIQCGKVCIVFCDNGVPYNPLTQDAPDITAPAEDRTIGGLGLFMVKQLMDDVSYQYSDAQNVLTLCLQLCQEL